MASSILDDTKIRSDGTYDFTSHVRNVDWASTCMGPMTSWPPDILQICHLILLDPLPRLLLLGKDDNLVLHNQAFATLLGVGLPISLGLPLRQAFGSAADVLVPHLATDSDRHASSVTVRVDLPPSSNNHTEAIALNWTLIPFAGTTYGYYVSVAVANDTPILAQIPAPIDSGREQSPDKDQINQRTSHDQHVINEAWALSQTQADLAASRLDRTQKIIQMIDVGVFEYHPGGDLMEANNAYFRLSGIPSDPAMWKDHPFTDRVHPDDKDMALDKWAGMIKGVNTTFDMRWKSDRKSPDGDFAQWVQAACIPVLDQNGDVQSIYGAITDISAQRHSLIESQKRMEAFERAIASEQRFRTFTDTAPVAILIIDALGKVTYVNQRWFQITGTDHVEFDKIDWLKSVYDEDQPSAAAAWQKLLTTRSLITMQCRLKNSTWIQATVMPELDKSGEFVAGLITMTDINHLKWAESIQKLKLDEVVEAKRQQENFIDMTSHEIRNPLSAVVHCAESLGESLAEMEALSNAVVIQKSQEAQVATLRGMLQQSIEAVNTIKACSDHQRRIVEDILVASKLDSKLLTVAPTETRVAAIIDEVHRMFEAEADMANVQFETKADPSLDSIDWILVDNSRIKQILINLTQNAVKFCRTSKTQVVTLRVGASKLCPSGDHLGVTFAHRDTADANDNEAGPDDFFLWFTVQDTGIGMTAEVQRKLFARFVQGSPRTYSEYGGSGLGLFICRELARLQGGDIGVSSEVNIGSTFAFYVRTCHTQAPVPITLNGSLTTRIRSNPSPTVKRTASEDERLKPSILIVEDNLVNQKVLKMRLVKLGHNVHVANNGVEAIDFLQKSRRWRDALPTSPSVSIVLMDIFMPLMDGLTATRRIRELEREGQLGGRIPIIAISANARPEQKNEALLAGMDDTIAKPFPVNELTGLFEKLAF